MPPLSQENDAPQPPTNQVNAMPPNQPGSSVLNSTPQNQGPSKNKWLFFALGGIVIILIAVMIFFLTRSDDKQNTQTPVKQSAQSTDEQMNDDDLGASANVATGQDAKDLMWQKVTLDASWQKISEDTGTTQYQLSGTRCVLTLDQPSGVNQSNDKTSADVAESYARMTAQSLEDQTGNVFSKSSTGTKLLQGMVNDKTFMTLAFATVQQKSGDGQTVVDTYAYRSGDYALIATVACGSGGYDTFASQLSKAVDSLKGLVTY